MRKLLFAIGLFLLFATYSVAYADSDCVKDGNRLICAPFGGSVLRDDNSSRIVCAPGKCARSEEGKILCASQAGGSILKHIMKDGSKLVCDGGCIEPDASYCMTPR